MQTSRTTEESWPTWSWQIAAIAYWPRRRPWHWFGWYWLWFAGECNFFLLNYMHKNIYIPGIWPSPVIEILPNYFHYYDVWRRILLFLCSLINILLVVISEFLHWINFKQWRDDGLRKLLIGLKWEACDFVHAPHTTTTKYSVCVCVLGSFRSHDVCVCVCVM